MILFTTFYPLIILEILQILLLMSYKLACHQSKIIISNIYSLYFLNNTNHIFTPLVCKFFSSYEVDQMDRIGPKCTKYDLVDRVVGLSTETRTRPTRGKSSNPYSKLANSTLVTVGSES